MAIKRINQIYFLADTTEDLGLIPNVRQGYEAYVISEGCEYKATSEAEWFKQAGECGEIPEVDLSGYVKKEEMEKAIDTIEIPSVEGLASEAYVDAAIAEASSIKDIYGDAHCFGLMVDSSDNKTLIEAMLEKGKVGMYNFHIEKGCPGQPEEVTAKNSSCRGIACVDTYRSDSNWYGWIIMMDQDGDTYTQYIRNAKPQGWKKLLTV